MVVGSNPADPANEDAYNEWYNETHLDDVLKIGDFTAARRYSLSDVRPMAGTEPSPYGYLALYEIESDDLAATARKVQEALDSGALPISEHFDLGGFSVDFYELLPESERTG